jgi:PKD repeat protein
MVSAFFSLPNLIAMKTVLISMKKLLLILVLNVLSVLSFQAQNCQAGFNYTSNGLTVQFQDSSFSTSGISNYNWNFGNGSFSTSSNPTHTYLSPGTYFVCLTISDSLCTDSICYSISVQNNQPNCSANFYSIKNGLTVQFFDSSSTSNQTDYIWTFGNGLTSFVQNPTHTYSQAGAYIVGLSIYDSLTNCTDQFYDTISIQPIVSCNANFSYRVNNDSLFIQNLADSLLLISYDFGDNNFSNLNNPVHVYTQSGTYIVCQTVTDSANCFATYSDTVQINITRRCLADFTYNVNNRTIDIVNRAVNYNSVLYNFGDGVTTSALNPTHTYSANGTYVICQTVSSSAICSDTKCDTVVINVAPPCQAGFSYQANFTQVDFFNQALNFTGILYEFGDGDSSNLSNPTHNYSTPGTYIVSQTVNNQNNCTSIYTDTITVSIPPPCVADFSCSTIGDTTEFTSNSSNYNRLIYYFGDGDSSLLPNPRHTYATSGTFTVQLVVFNDSTNCIDSLSKTVTVTVSQSCVAKFELALDTNQRNILFLVNTSSSDNTHQYFWDFDDGTSSTNRLPTHQYAQNRAYNICLTVFDTLQNCTSIYCDSVGLDSNGNILKSAGFFLRVLNGGFIGIEEESLERNVSIYPNPFQNQFTIETSLVESEIDYQIISVTGKVLSQGQFNTNMKQLEIVNCPPGIYFLKLMHKGKAIVKRVVKI